VAGTTETPRIDGRSTASDDGDRWTATPTAVAELIEYGRLVRASCAPTGGAGRPSPAVVTRAARECTGFETLVVDAGLADPTGAPTVDVGAKPGRDVRGPDPVPTAPGAWAVARELGRALPDDELVVGESISGGTTTALGVCRALGVEVPVPSTLPEHALARGRTVIDAAFEASDVDPGGAAHHPKLAVRFVGDPVLAVVAGLTDGALASGTDVILGGGTRMLTAAALVRHAGVADPLTVASTSGLATDLDLPATAAELNCEAVVADPVFDERSGVLARDDAETVEGAGVGGALVLAERAGTLDAVGDAAVEVAARLTDGRRS
jgi:NaMN:DMB phosphoribosyltransferase